VEFSRNPTRRKFRIKNSRDTDNRITRILRQAEAGTPMPELGPVQNTA